MTFKFRSLWSWLATNWEPLTSVLALIVSAWSGALAYQGIMLANRSIELSQQAQKEAYRAAVLSRTPVFSIFRGPKNISVKNLGLGPGSVYQINASARELSTTIENSNPKQAAEKLEVFFTSWIASIKGLPSNFQDKLSFGNILGLYNVGQENALIQMKDGSDFPEVFYREVKTLFLTACFSDLAADTSGSSSSEETDSEELLACSPPRSMFHFIERP